MSTIIKPSVKIPRTVWVLGCVSLLMDVSSELIHSLLPVFITVTLGASATMLGMIEGIAEATALIVKIFSGVLSDYVGKRKWLTVLGYGMSALSKPLFALANSVGWVFTARFADRIGKGVRGAPRDAMIADVAPAEIRGAAFGLRQALDTIGAFAGPLLAIVLMLKLANDMHLIFWLAAIPAFLATALLLFGVHEPVTATAITKRPFPISRAGLKQLPAKYWWVVAIGTILTLARFSEAFLVLRARQGGLSLEWTPLVLVVMNVIYAAMAYPLGKLADKLNHDVLLLIGIVPLIIADLLLARSAQLEWVGIGLLFWGLHMAATQGLLAAMVADTAPAALRGTAFGFFNLMSGLAMLLASIVAGVLWDQIGAATTFYTGAFFSAGALLLLLFRKN
jgi:MFS family permease